MRRLSPCWVEKARASDFFKAVFFIAIWISFSACGTYPGETQSKESPLPREEIVKRWQSLTEGPADSSLGILTLDRAIEEALRASPEIEQIAQRIDASFEQVRQAAASFYPRLILGEEFNVTNNPVYGLMNIINQRRLQSTVDFNNPGQQQNFETRIQGQWTLFEGGIRYHDGKAARHRYDSVGAELLSARNLLVAKVTETYYHWLQALDFISVADRALEAAEKDEMLGEERFRAQIALSSEVARLKARTAEVRGNLVTARTGARRLQAAMERFLARPIGSAEIPTLPFLASPAPQPGIPEAPDALMNHALERRPELEAVRALIRAAQESIRSAQGGLLPTLNSNLWYQWDGEDLSEGARSWMVGLQANWVLFEGGLTLSKVREARARLKEIEARGTQIALDIALEVHQAVLAVEEAGEKIRVASERKEWALKALEEVRNLYRNQVVTVDALLQAGVAWNQAEAAYTAALFDERIARALLSKALGDFAHWMEAGND